MVMVLMVDVALFDVYVSVDSFYSLVMCVGRIYRVACCRNHSRTRARTAYFSFNASMISIS